MVASVAWLGFDSPKTQQTGKLGKEMISIQFKNAN